MSLIEPSDVGGFLREWVSHALAGRKFRGPSTIFSAFTLRSADHTTWLGNVYGQSHSSRILVHLSEVVISYVCLINAKHPDIRHGLLTSRDLRPACQCMGYLDYFCYNGASAIICHELGVDVCAVAMVVGS